MSTIARINTLLLEGPIDAICSATVVYLTMENGNIPPYDVVKDLAHRAVNSALTKIDDDERKAMISEVLQGMKNGYRNVVGLNAIRGLNMVYYSAMNAIAQNLHNEEPELDQTRDKIEENVDLLKEKLKHPILETDVLLYSALRKEVNDINLAGLSWTDHEANMVLSDKSTIQPRENMRCTLSEQVASTCDNFIENFAQKDVSKDMKNVFHNRRWKESDSTLVQVGEIWSNPAFATRTSRREQSEGTYITDVIIPLLRASLVDLPIDHICLSTAERQSAASKARRKAEVGSGRRGKSPDIMAIERWEEKVIELLYVESSRVVCTDKKANDDYVKLWRETLDGVNYVSSLMQNQFGIVGIQVAGEMIFLNVMMNDTCGIPRYFHLCEAEIPLTVSKSSGVKTLVHLLLTLRNILLVNKSLLMQALKQAVSRPPRNVHPTSTVTSPPSSPPRTKRSSDYVYYQDLQAGLQSRSSLSLSQLPTNVFTFGGLPTYSISQLTNEQQTPVYIDGSNLAMHERLVTGSIQQQNDTLSTRQNLLTHQQQRQRWLSQYPYSRQREIQTSSELFTPPMQSEHQVDRQNSVQDMHGVFPIEQSEYFQSQVYPTTGSPIIFDSHETNIQQQMSLQQSNFDRLVTGFPDKSSQMEIDERSSRSQ
ncbi:1880_t:CDS:2, partial [Paraglomus brasilianum]